MSDRCACLWDPGPPSISLFSNFSSLCCFSLPSACISLLFREGVLFCSSPFFPLCSSSFSVGSSREPGSFSHLAGFAPLGLRFKLQVLRRLSLCLPSWFLCRYV